MHEAPGSTIGIDVGISHLATTSDGQFFVNARPRKKREKELSLAARALARCKRGSKRRRKVKAKLARIQR